MTEAELEQQATTARIRIDVFEAGKCLGSFSPDNKDKIIIGRSKTADICVPHTSISGIHAMIRMTGKEEAVLYDLGSKHGTYQGQKRHKVVETALGRDSSFYLGEQEFRVSFLQCNREETIAPETCLFWRGTNTSSDVLDTVLIENGAVSEIFHVEAKQKLKAGFKLGEIDLGEAYGRNEFLRRRHKNGREFVEIFAAEHFNIEVYDGQNNLISKQNGTGEWASFESNHKVRITFDNKELQLFWREAVDRMNRTTKEADARELHKSTGASLLLALLIVGTSMIHQMLKKEEEVEIDLSKKTSYFRVKKSKSAAAAPAPAGNPEAAPQVAKTPVPKSAPAQKNVVKNKTQTANKVSSVLSNILNRSKKSAITKQATGNRVVKAAVVPTDSSAFKQSNISGAQAGSVDSAALSKMGGGKVKGLGGFGGKGAANSVGRSFGGSGNAAFGVKFNDGDASVQGGIDRAAIAAVVRANIGQIKHCYERQLIVDPSLSGKLVAKWTINDKGQVNSTSVKNTTLGSKSAVDCMLRKIAKWKFPKPRGGGRVVVSYPFLFKAVN